MNTCAHCQAPLDPNWKFCVNCGTSNPANAQPASHHRPAPDEHQPFLSGEPEQPATRAAAKAAAATATKLKERTTTSTWSLAEDVPAAIRNSQDRPPARGMGRRTVDVSLIVSISLGIAGAALIVYLVVLVFGTRG